MPRPQGTAEELERRRERAVQAVDRGESPTTVARVLGVHVASVHRWRRMARSPGGLKAIEQPGPTPGLDDAQMGRLEALLVRGAKAHGWHNELWTAGRHGVEPRSISFKGALRTLEAFQPVIALRGDRDSAFRGDLYERLLDAVASHRVGDRPDRYEPRRRKRRPKPYDRLMKPRHEAKRAILKGVRGM